MKLKNWKWFALFAVFVFCAIFIRDFRRINNYPINSWNEGVTGDCGIVLTGGAGRVREGFDLLSQEQIKKLIISGVNPRAQLTEIFPQLPYYPNVDEQNVILERRSTTTFGNVYQSLSIAEALKCRSIVIITSRIHMYRAHRSFESALPEGIVATERAVLSGGLDFDFTETLLETMKSVFYSLWAY